MQGNLKTTAGQQSCTSIPLKFNPDTKTHSHTHRDLSIFILSAKCFAYIYEWMNIIDRWVVNRRIDRRIKSSFHDYLPILFEKSQSYIYLAGDIPWLLRWFSSALRMQCGKLDCMICGSGDRDEGRGLKD